MKKILKIYEKMAPPQKGQSHREIQNDNGGSIKIKNR